MTARRATAVQARAADATVTTVPGVVQINPLHGTTDAYFVCTETIPAGSSIQMFIKYSDNFEIVELDTQDVSSDLLPGFSLALPAIRFNSWKSGMTIYYVTVTLPDGTQPTAAADFSPTSESPDYARTQVIVPGVTRYSESLADDGSTLVTLKGRFLTGTAASVVLDEYVVPASAITIVDAATITFNLSQAAGADWSRRLASYQDPLFNTSATQNVLLTVAQAGWSDTIPFRHTPLK
jgi:hypothetical protein